MISFKAIKTIFWSKRVILGTRNTKNEEIWVFPMIFWLILMYTITGSEFKFNHFLGLRVPEMAPFWLKNRFNGPKMVFMGPKKVDNDFLW